MSGGKDGSGALAREIVRQLDELEWTVGRETADVRVAWSDAVPGPVRGYRTTTRHRVPFEEVVGFLGAGLLDAFERLNERWAWGEVVSASPRVVRTAFTMPWPFRGREFLHSLEEVRLAPGVHVIGYGDAPEGARPTPRPGWVRCPIFPSGQRIRALDDGWVEVEHLMVYALAGAVPHGVQSRLFHRGHLGAYTREWQSLVDVFRDAARGRAPRADVGAP